MHVYIPWYSGNQKFFEIRDSETKTADSETIIRKPFFGNHDPLFRNHASCMETKSVIREPKKALGNCVAMNLMHNLQQGLSSNHCEPAQKP